MIFFAAFAEDESMSHVSQINMITETEVLPEWLAEVTDDLDVYMAQRDFEEAVSLIEKNRAYWESASPSVVNIHRDLKYDSLRFIFKYLLKLDLNVNLTVE
jgi:hypothetical protein